MTKCVSGQFRRIVYFYIILLVCVYPLKNCVTFTQKSIIPLIPKEVVLYRMIADPGVYIFLPPSRCSSFIFSLTVIT